MCTNSCCIDYDAFTINCRPVDKDKHVEPSTLLEYCEQHHFWTPLCLCPLLQTHSDKPTIMETTILEKMSGTHIAEYVAECASGCCRYFGEFSVIFQEWRMINKNKTQFLYIKHMELVESQWNSILQKVGCFVEKLEVCPVVIFEATKNINLPSAIAWPDVEQSRSHRPLKQTYAIAGQLIRSKQEQKLTSTVRSNRPQFHYYSQANQIEKIWQDWAYKETWCVWRRIFRPICQVWHLPGYYCTRCILIPPGGLPRGCSCRGCCNWGGIGNYLSSR